MKITIVLISPETPGNIGAIARIMANFNAKKLVIINPECNVLAKEALDRASHAKNILKKAIIINEKDNSIIKNKIRKLGNHIIATTAKLANDYNILRTAEQSNDILPRLAEKDSDIVLLFGRESSGLSNRELEFADFTMTIPTSSKYPVLNLSHAVSVCLYELYTAYNSKKINEKKPRQAKQKEITQLNKLINETIDEMSFIRESQDQTLRLTWKKVISKLMLTRRETFALIGYFKKLLKRR